ncbi:MAG: SMC-Scp complex subunit ScpB [Nevskiales bacterium]
MDNPQTESLADLPPEAPAAVESEALQDILEAVLLAADQPLPLERLMAVFPEQERPDKKDLRAALDALRERYADRVAEVLEVGSGWRIQVRERFAPYIAQLWEEKPPRYSRALLETLALIAYRQPITRGEVEEIRGVMLSPSIIKTLLEREWVKVLGVREVPGRPELLGTTRQFLDDFNLQSLESMPTLPEIRDLDALASALEKLQPTDAATAQAPADAGPVSSPE